MKLMNKIAVAAAVLASTVGTASATETIVTPSTTSWRVTTGTSNSAKITGTLPQAGNGSLELKGDVSRFTFGGTNFLAPAIASLSTVRSLTFDWRIAGDSVSALNPDYTPALRLNIKNGFSYGELVWEGVYNGRYGDQTVADTWYSTDPSALFYFGRGNENAGKTLTDWASSMGNWNVVGMSVGQGSSAGSGYHAFADNVTLTTTGGSTTYNFEAAASPGAVPEPATWAMMILGMGAVGFAMRSAKRRDDKKFDEKIKRITSGLEA